MVRDLDGEPVADATIVLEPSRPLRATVFYGEERARLTLDVAAGQVIGVAARIDTSRGLQGGDVLARVIGEEQAGNLP